MTIKESTNNEEYLYCQVQFQGIQRTYFYISDDPAICIGDFVSVPFGKNNIETTGKVRSVAVHSAEHTPYPPHLTKHIICKTTRPAEWNERDIKLERTQEYQPIDPSSVTSGIPSVSSSPAIWEASEIAQDSSSDPYDKYLKNYIAKTKKQKKYSPRTKAIAVLASVVVLIGAFSTHHFVRDYKYENAIKELEYENYAAAYEQFTILKNYRDANELAVFCRYTDLYKTSNTYAGGENELAEITLKYEKSFQNDVDALEERVAILASEKRIADEAERERLRAEAETENKEKYGGELPAEGMPVNCLKYTVLGAPDRTEKCENYDMLEGEHKRKSLYWYDDDGTLVASGISFRLENDTEEMLYGFDYYGDPIEFEDDENREWSQNNN